MSGSEVHGTRPTGLERVHRTRLATELARRDAHSPRITPTIRRIVDRARTDGLSVAEMLEDVQAHARRHQNGLTFEDAVQLARMLRPQEDGS